MRPALRSFGTRYGFAVLAVTVAVLVRLALEPVLADRLPFLLAALAVVAVAWHGGFGPSVVALLLGGLAATYLFLPPRYTLAESLSEHRVLLGGFAFLGVAIGLFSERLRAARRRAEAQTHEAVRQRQELEQEMAERRRLEQELQRRNEELAAADRRKDEFLAMLGHELRNPLAPVRNALYLLRSPGSAPAMLQQVGAMIERQVLHLQRLVDDLLDVSRITRGKVQIRKDPLPLGDMLRWAVESTRPLLEANRHTLTLALLPEPVRVLGDATRLEQVFANLLNNAAKYTEPGGAIRVSEERHDDAVVIRIRDTGFGIPAATLPHVFDLFVQADRTLDRAQGGLGIGLTLAKRLIELHDGSVTAHSDGPGQGSEFVVRLPIHRDPADRADTDRPSAAMPAALPAGRSPALHVLVVEDNKDTAESLATLLRLWGHEVRTSGDGMAGLKAAQSHRPQIVLLDIGLPGLNGYEVARQLRGEFGSAMRLVAMTGYGQDEDRRRAVEAGFDAHLVKPADPELLQQLLRCW